MNKYFNKGFISNGVLNLTPLDSYELCNQGGMIVDVREKYLSNFKMFNLGNVLNIPFSELKNSFGNIPQNIPVIFADAVGLRSRDGVIFMTKHGYENVANMAGGVVDW